MIKKHKITNCQVLTLDSNHVAAIALNFSYYKDEIITVKILFLDAIGLTMNSAMVENFHRVIVLAYKSKTIISYINGVMAQKADKACLSFAIDYCNLLATHQNNFFNSLVRKYGDQISDNQLTIIFLPNINDYPLEIRNHLFHTIQGRQNLQAMNIINQDKILSLQKSKKIGEEFSYKSNVIKQPLLFKIATNKEKEPILQNITIQKIQTEIRQNMLNNLQKDMKNPSHLANKILFGNKMHLIPQSNDIVAKCLNTNNRLNS